MRARGLVVASVLLLAASRVFAQQPAQSFAQLQVLLAPGETIWLTDADGREVEGRLRQLTPDAVQVDVDGQGRTWEASQVRSIRHRHNDSVVNGALIGGAVGAGVYAGLVAALCSEGSNCRGGQAVGAVAAGFLVGAGLGTLVDALVRGQRTIYTSPDTPSTSVTVVPVVAPRHASVSMTLRF